MIFSISTTAYSNRNSTVCTSIHAFLFISYSLHMQQTTGDTSYFNVLLMYSSGYYSLVFNVDVKLTVRNSFSQTLL